MALDLTGFTIPEQKFEGLYKLGEQLAEKRKAEDAAKLAQQKLQAEKDKLQSENLTGFLSDLQKMTDPKDYYSNRVVGNLTNIYSELSNAARSGANTNELRMRAVPLVNNAVKEADITKTLSSQIDKDLENYPKDYYNIPHLKNEVYSAVFKNPDGTDKTAEEIAYSPNSLSDIIQNKGYNLVNSSSILKNVKETPNQTVSVKKTYRDKSGKESTSFIETEKKPWEFYDEKTNQILPYSIIATDEGKPILHEGKPVNIVPDEVYNDFVNKNIANRDFLNSQTKLHLDEYDKQVAPTAGVTPESSKIDINSPQANLIKKAILYDFLYQNKTGGIKKETETKYKMPTEGGGGISYSQKKDIDAQSALTTSVQARNQDAKGYVDITDKFGGYKYGKRRFGKDGVLYNPETQEFKLKLIDENGNVTEEVKTFDDVTSTIYASNPEKNIDVLEGLKKVTSKKSDDDISMYDPATQAGIKSYSNAKKISISKAKKKLKAAGKIK